jgi:hypothetical protein
MATARASSASATQAPAPRSAPSSASTRSRRSSGSARRSRPTPPTSYQGDPSLAADAAGKFVVVWTSYLQDGGDLGIYGQRYGQIVRVELMHFRVE